MIEKIERRMKLGKINWKECLIALLLLVIPLYLLSYCYRMKIEKFGFFRDNSKDWEQFKNKVDSFPKVSDIKTTFRGTSDDFKDASNDEFIDKIGSKTPLQKIEPFLENENPDVKNQILNENIKNSIEKDKNIPKPNMSQCGFYANQCPTGYNKISGFGLLGLPEDISFQCGNQRIITKKTAQQEIDMKFDVNVREGKIQSIDVLDTDLQLDPKKNYFVLIEDTQGKGAKIDLILDDNGKIQVMNVIDGGRDYENPKIKIKDREEKEMELSGMENEGNCLFCCPT
jgi:hypothetical protein